MIKLRKANIIVQGIDETRRTSTLIVTNRYLGSRLSVRRKRWPAGVAVRDRDAQSSIIILLLSNL
jgi:hypothetical protein